jgi:hypothetical protein
LKRYRWGWQGQEASDRIPERLAHRLSHGWNSDYIRDTFTVNASARNLQPDTYVNSIDFYNTTNSQGNTTRLATLTVNPKQYTITVRASPSADGTVSGGGTY